MESLETEESSSTLPPGMASRGTSEKSQYKGQQRTDEDDPVDLVELRHPENKRIGVHLKLTDECSIAMRVAKKAKMPVRLEHHEAGTFIEIDTGGEQGKKRFECGVQKLPDQSVIDVIALDKRSGEHRRFATLEAKLQVRATDQTFSSAAQKAHKLVDDQRRAQTIQGVYTKGQKRPALIQPSTSSKAKRALLSASSTPNQHTTNDKTNPSDRPSSSSLHGSRDRHRPAYVPSSSAAALKPTRRAESGLGSRQDESRQRAGTFENSKHEKRPSTSRTAPSPVSKPRIGPRSPQSPHPQGGESHGASEKSTSKKPDRAVTTGQSTSAAGQSTFTAISRPRKGPRTPLSTPPDVESPRPASCKSPQRDKPDRVATSNTQNTTASKSPRRRSHPSNTATNRADSKTVSRAQPTPASTSRTHPEAPTAVDGLGRPVSAQSLSSLGSSPSTRGGAHSCDASLSSPIRAPAATAPHPSVSSFPQYSVNGTTLPALNGCSGLSRPTVVATDWWAELPPIDSPGKLNEYRAEYKVCYDEYAKLYRQLDKVASQFRKLKAESDKHSTGDTAKKIHSLYDKYNNDDVFYAARQRHTDLRAKLVVLKQRVADHAEPVPARS